MYGSRTDAEGKPLQANGASPLMTGEKVAGHELVYFGPAKDQNGTILDNRYEIHFRQPSGRLFTYSFFNSEEGWAIEKTNRTILHICTKIVTEEEYYGVVSGAANFTDFMDRVRTHIIPKAKDIRFTLKIVYIMDKSTGNWYAKFPNFPNFIERDGTTPSTLSTNPKYDVYEIPATTAAINTNIPAGFAPPAVDNDVF